MENPQFGGVVSVVVTMLIVITSLVDLAECT